MAVVMNSSLYNTIINMQNIFAAATFRTQLESPAVLFWQVLSVRKFLCLWSSNDILIPLNFTGEGPSNITVMHANGTYQPCLRGLGGEQANLSRPPCVIAERRPDEA